MSDLDGKMAQFSDAFNRMAAPFLPVVPYEANDIDRAELHRVIKEGSLKGQRLGVVLPPVIRKLHEAGSRISWYAALQLLLGMHRTKWQDIKRRQTAPDALPQVNIPESHRPATFYQELLNCGFSEKEIAKALEDRPRAPRVVEGEPEDRFGWRAELRRAKERRADALIEQAEREGFIA